MQDSKRKELHSNCQRQSTDTDTIIENSEQWTTRSIFLAAFLFRVLLVFYGRIHDYLFKVSFTDVDYKVFSDAAKHVYDGRSPFLRSTYRYSPLLAWALVPNVVWPEFGKLLFCSLDILVGFLCLKVALQATTSSLSRVELERSRNSVICFWLINPLTAVISARGNGDVLVCAAVVSALYLFLKGKWFSAAALHGLAIHLKLYPIIYFPSLFLYLSRASRTSSFNCYLKKILLNRKGIMVALVSFVTFFALTGACYCIYGDVYLREALFYHVTRTDTRHNFSPYFYILYLSSANLSLSRLVSIGAFLPQAALVLYFGFRYYEDLPFCWLLSTISFVAFNKVCTSQYFVWYICLLPAAQNSLQLSKKRATTLVLLWFSGQALWLLPAYLFEFKGFNTFLYMWMASLLYLTINSGIIVQLCLHHFEPNLAVSQTAEKKMR